MTSVLMIGTSAEEGTTPVHWYSANWSGVILRVITVRLVPVAGVALKARSDGFLKRLPVMSRTVVPPLAHSVHFRCLSVRSGEATPPPSWLVLGGGFVFPLSLLNVFQDHHRGHVKSARQLRDGRGAHRLSGLDPHDRLRGHLRQSGKASDAQRTIPTKIS